MTDHLRRSISSGNGSPENKSQGMAEAHDPTTEEVTDSPERQPDLALDIQALQILDSSDDCIKVLDLEGRILFMSRGGQVLLGIQDIKPFLNTSWIEFWQGADRQAASEAIAKARAGEVCTFQGYCPTPSREPKWWECKVSPIQGMDGQVERLLCISRDITERRQIEDQRKQAEEQSRESEERYRAIINQAVAGVACAALDGNLTLVNQKYCDITGYSADELMQLRMQDITHPDDLPRNVELFHRMQSEGTPFEIEKRYIRKDGSIVWVNNSVSVICDRDGKPQSAVAIVIDITERKQAEQAPRESEARLLLVANLVPDLLWDSEPNGSTNWYNQRWMEYTGQTFEQAIGWGWTDAIHPDDREGSARRYREAVEQGMLLQQEHRIRRHDGAYRWFIVKASPLKDESGKVIKMYGAATDIHEQRVALEALRDESEAKYRALFTSIDEGFTLLEMIPDESGHPADFRIVETNPAWEQQTGLTDAVGKTLLEIAPNFEQQLLDFYSDVVISGRGRRTEYYTASTDRWYTVYASRIGGEGSHQVAVVFNDITERKRAEEQLRDSAERQQFLLKFSDTLRVLPDKETIERTSLQLLAEYLRLDRVYIAAVYSNDDRAVIGPEYHRPDLMPMVGELPLSDFPEAFRIVEEQTLVIDNIADHPTLSELDRQSLAAINLTALVVASARRGERNVIWSVLAAMTTPRNWTTGEVALLEAVAERIWAMVERVNAEAALRESEARYRSLFESMDEAYAVVEVLADDNGKWNDFLFLEVNPAFVKQTGMEYPVGRTVTELLGTPNPRWAEVYGRVAETGEPIRFEESEATLGRVFDLYVFRLGGDGSRRIAVLFNNITDRKQAEAQRKQLLEREQAAREEAEQANRIKDEFLAVLSHELRSPLNPILGWSKLLQNRKLDETKTAQALATIERNAKLQSELIEDLLDVSRILRGKLSLNVAPVNLAATIRGAIETVRLAAEAKSIQVEANLAPDVGQVWGDSTRLQQVVWNLLSNAVKFTSPGGQVNIRLERVDSSAQITVSDTGQGIAPDFLPYVFDYFRQADAATTRKFGGLGLGLAIVRHLVELHGGTVRAESLGEGQGATFTIRLPLVPTPSQANQDDRSPQQSLDLNGIKILIVDDEPDTRELVAFVLEQQGAQVTAATSAHEALLILPQAKPDMLLSDIGMPEMDGYMLIQQVRALAPDQGGQIPAIALTAYAGDTNQQQVLTAGFQKHISKPIEPEELVQAIVGLVRSA